MSMESTTALVDTPSATRVTARSLTQYARALLAVVVAIGAIAWVLALGRGAFLVRAAAPDEPSVGDMGPQSLSEFELLPAVLTDTAEPGDVVVFSHVLTNTGYLLDTFDLSADGDQPTWVEVAPSSATLIPGMTTTVRMTVTVPLGAVAGDVATGLTATSRDTGDTRVATDTVTVLTSIAGLSATSDSPTQEGQATTFTATVTGGAEPIAYLWAFGDGITGTGTITTHTYAGIGTYTATVTATNVLGSAFTETVVTVLPNAIVGLAATDDSPTLLGDATMLTATVTGGTLPITYEWEFGDGITATGAMQTYTYAGIGTYTATVTATNPAGESVAETLVTVVPRPILGLAATSDSPTQLGAETAFTATLTDGTPPITYAWDFGDGATGSGATTTHTYLSVGTFTATVTATNGAGDAVAQTLVDVLPNPILGLAATSDSPTQLLDQTTFTATVTSGTPPITYTWNFGDGATGSGVTTTHTYASVGTFTATVTATNGAGNATAQTVVEVLPNPIAGLSAVNDGPMEVGSLTTMTATVTGGTLPIAYTWNFGDGITDTGAVATHIYAVYGTYTATVTATNASNTQVAQTVVTILPAPVSGLDAQSDLSTYLGDPTYFTATVTGGTMPIAFVWDFGDGITGTGATISHTYAVVGPYTATVTATNAAGSVTDTAAAYVYIIPPDPITDLTAVNDSPTQEGAATAFTATVTGGTEPINYEWDFGDGEPGAGATPTHTYAMWGTYTATVTATNAAGVAVTTTVLTVLPNPIVGLTAVNDGPTQLGEETAFTATVTGGTTPIDYTWAFGDGITGTGAVPTHTYATWGTFTATVTATNAASSVFTTTVVTVSPNPILGLVATSDSPTIFGQTTTLTASVTGGTEPITYTWDFGDGDGDLGAVVTHIYPGVDTYTATVAATNPAGLAVATTLVFVSEVPPDPIVGLSAINDSPTSLGDETAFTATVTGGTPPIAYVWNFGDGMTGAGVTTTHTYAGVGIFTATVTATNAAGPAVATTVVTVSQAQIKVFLPLVVKPSTPANLMVTGIAVTPASPVAGSAATVCVTVANTGGQPLSYGNNFFVDLYINHSPVPGDYGDRWWGAQATLFGAGESYTFCTDDDADDGEGDDHLVFGSAGEVNLYAQVDTLDNVAEGNESDNVLGPQPVTVLASGR